MKVAIVIHGYPPRIGGAERQVSALAPRLLTAGLKITVITRRLPDTVPFEIRDGISIYRLPAPGPKAIGSLLFTLRSISLIKTTGPDLIHAHELISPATSAWASNRTFGIPFILTPHLSGPKGDVGRMHGKFLGTVRLKQLVRHAAAFVSISNDIDNELESIGVPKEKRRFIPNGVDVDRFLPANASKKQELRRKMNLPAKAPIAVCMARLVPIKRLDLLIAIWPQVRSENPDARLMVLGSGPLEASLRDKAGEGITFWGNQEDVVPFLQVSDAFVLASDDEGLPMALLEAMSCGLPCVATRVGGTPDVIQHELSGILVNRGVPSAILDGILSLFAKEEMRLAMGEQARRTICERYSLEETARQHVLMYEQVLQQRGRK